jgi:uncharacterized protein YlxW (UPF0749 family)
MATARNRQVENLEAQRAKLFDEVTDLLANAGSGPDEADPAIGLAAGTVAVTGAGLTVRLDDSQADSAILPDSPSNPAERLVHQQDIDAVMNALWRGGAEAMSVQGHRVVSNTVVKCVGNVILVAGRVYSPPYSISAIGPPEVMRQALASAPMVVAYRDRATRLGLTWEVSGENDLTMMANLPGPPRLRYAQTTAARLDGVRP